MNHNMILWCVYCDHLGKGARDNGRKCIQCLRDTINMNVHDVEQPKHYEGEGVQ